MTTRPLLPALWRGPLAIVAVLTLVGVAVLGVREYERPRLTAFDVAMNRWVETDWPSKVLHAGLDLTSPWLDVAVLAVVVIAALLFRRVDVAVLAVVGPGLAVLLTEKVIKPLVHRTSRLSLAFPSGHETGFAATAVVLAIVLFSVSWSIAVRAIVVVGLAGLTVIAAAGLVAYRYHIATETIGGIGMAIGCVLGVALAIDQITAWRASPRDR